MVVNDDRGLITLGCSVVNLYLSTHMTRKMCPKQRQFCTKEKGLRKGFVYDVEMDKCGVVTFQCNSSVIYA